MTSDEETMLAGVATPRGVEILQVPRPRPKENQVLVRVHAAGINWGDLLTAAGAEWAGEVVEVGGKVRGRSIGETR